MHALNANLPERYRLSILDMVLKDNVLGRLTKRELRKLLFQEWKALGYSVPHSKAAGSINKGKRVLSAFYQAPADVLSNGG